MASHDVPPGKISDRDRPEEDRIRLQLFLAGATPNSTRAHHNLVVVLERMKERAAEISLQIIDVYVNPKSALTAGVIVTPTLIGSCVGKRVCLLGDLADRDHLYEVIFELMT